MLLSYRLQSLLNVSLSIYLLMQVFSFEPIAPKTQFQAWSGTFTALPDMPRERVRHGSFQVGNNLCVIGGRDVSDTLIPQIDCYDTTTNVWTEVGTLPMEYQTSDFAWWLEGTKVHLIGGYNQIYVSLSQVTLVDMSNLTDIQFEPGVPIDSPRGDISAVEVENDSKILISGGFTHLNDFAEPFDSVIQFDVESQTWGPANSLNEERGDKVLVVLNDKVFAIGGEDREDDSAPADVVPDDLPDDGFFISAAGQGSIALDSVEMMDLTAVGEVEWKRMSIMPYSLFRFGVSEWQEDGSDGDGVIFVFGGQIGFEVECECFPPTEKVLVFDPSKIGKALEQDVAPSAGVVISHGLVVGYIVFVAATVLMLA